MKEVRDLIAVPVDVVAKVASVVGSVVSAVTDTVVSVSGVVASKIRGVLWADRLIWKHAAGHPSTHVIFVAGRRLCLVTGLCMLNMRTLVCCTGIF